MDDTPRSVKDVLNVLGCTDISFFEGCQTLEDEFKALKRSWRDGARRCHPVSQCRNRWCEQNDTT